jgi:hypothetical protein
VRERNCIMDGVSLLRRGVLAALIAAGVAATWGGETSATLSAPAAKKEVSAAKRSEVIAGDDKALPAGRLAAAKPAVERAQAHKPA